MKLTNEELKELENEFDEPVELKMVDFFPGEKFTNSEEDRKTVLKEMKRAIKDIISGKAVDISAEDIDGDLKQFILLDDGTTVSMEDFLIGKTLSEAEEFALRNHFDLRFRKENEVSIWTQDYNRKRINLILNDEKIITKAFKG